MENMPDFFQNAQGSQQPMELKYFSLSEARAVLLLLSPVTERVSTLVRELMQQQKVYTLLQNRRNHNRESVPVWEVSEVRDAMQASEYELQKCLEQIARCGCQIKGVNPLLLDFPTRMGRRVVQLCWREGEPTISYWHDLRSGFRGRKLIQ